MLQKETDNILNAPGGERERSPLLFLLKGMVWVFCGAVVFVSASKNKENFLRLSYFSTECN